jgi:cytochrome bd-type quinol oxidase subunit 1
MTPAHGRAVSIRHGRHQHDGKKERKNEQVQTEMILFVYIYALFIVLAVKQKISRIIFKSRASSKQARQHDHHHHQSVVV